MRIRNEDEQERARARRTWVGAQEKVVCLDAGEDGVQVREVVGDGLVVRDEERVSCQGSEWGRRRRRGRTLAVPAQSAACGSLRVALSAVRTRARAASAWVRWWVWDDEGSARSWARAIGAGTGGGRSMVRVCGAQSGRI